MPDIEFVHHAAGSGGPKVASLLKNKKFLVIAGIVAGLALLLGARNRAQQAQQPAQEAQAALDNYGQAGGSGVDNAYAADIQNRYDLALKDQADRVAQVLTEQQQKYDQQLSQLTQTYDSKLQQQQQQAQQLYQQVADKLSSWGSVGGGMQTYTPYEYYPIEQPPQAIAPMQQQPPISPTAPAPAPSSTPWGWGVGVGSGTNSASNAANDSRLKTDAAYRQSEIERARTVIANRQAAGMDTSAQVAYLNQAMKYNSPASSPSTSSTRSSSTSYSSGGSSAAKTTTSTPTASTSKPTTSTPAKSYTQQVSNINTSGLSGYAKAYAEALKSSGGNASAASSAASKATSSSSSKKK